MRRACDRLAWPVVACALLLVCARAYAATDPATPGICPSMDIRNNPEQINKLKGCRVIEGQLSIVLMERVASNVFENISFPELREVTDYIMMYRTKGVQNLGDLFPNLTVIRGIKLFRDYALVIFDNENLGAIGLRSLMKIERGGVRIQQNDNLCYTDTIDWTRITSVDSNNVIRLNYDPRLCGLCPKAQSRMEDHRQLNQQCPSDAHGQLLCWDDKHCQKICPQMCGDNGCMESGVCCHKNCLGGCSGPTARDCFVCRGYSFKDGAERVCTETCPAGTYKLSRRCVTQAVCRSTPAPPPVAPEHDRHRAPPKINAYKIYQNLCVFNCPTGTVEVGDINNSTCVPCHSSGCVKECSGGKVDSVAAAELFRGCTHIQGKLEICIRATGGNVLKVLESSLGEIREITGSLQVSRAYPLVSLMFLKKLKKIVGAPNSEDKVLLIFNNPNLELLWDWDIHGPIDVSGGTLSINYNPKLCYNRILPLMNMTHHPSSNFSENEVSQVTNGEQASCLLHELHLKVTQLFPTIAVLSWDVYCPDDIRRLLGYSIYYIATEKNVTLYGQRDACFDTWNVLDVSMEETRNGSRTEQRPTNQKSLLTSACAHMQPSFYPISQLTPYTRYAVYVKTYTTLQEKKGAQSPIIYFRTLPGKPSPPIGLDVESLSPHSIYIKWAPPSMPNGTIILYHIEVQANNYNRRKILYGNTNYCSNPSPLVSGINTRGEEPKVKEDKGTGSAVNGSCACKEDEVKPSVRFNTRAEEERMETITFENELQNQVYKKSDKQKTKSLSGKRIKRQIDQSMNSMLVMLTKITGPKVGFQYKNTTDDEGYVKSMVYQLGSQARSVTVKGVRHFTWYTVNIWACRTRDVNESEAEYEVKRCSDRSFYTFRTSELLNADVVANVEAEVVPSNKTLPEVNVTWEPPRNPNGFVVAYNVHYSRVEENGQGQDVGLQSCVTANDKESSVRRSHTLRNMQPGNYSIQVRPITVAGAGNVSTEVFIFIPERTVGGRYEWAWGVAGGCVAVLAVLGAAAWYARRGLHPGAEANKLFASVNPEYVSTTYVPDEWEVPRSSIEFIRELGQGSFGMVYEGIVKNIEKGTPETRCAVKTVNEHATDRERQEFLNEASVMKAFDTFHVVRLLGVVSRGQPTLVIMELMECGDLKTYLRSHRPDADSSLPRKGPPVVPPTLQSILQMAIEIADGMAYLSAKKFVHRDLAARNCMVAGDLTVKVGDFGMTRDIYETDYYRKGTKGLLPVRWMSPESLKDGVFSSSSDVWSYGVVLWEMATLAMQPYQGLSNEQVLRYVVEGGVMERPEHCPDRLYELMRACWAHRPAQRPAFLHLVADLATSAQPYFRQRSFFHSPQGQEMYALQRSALEEEQDAAEVSVGAVATGSADLFGVSGRLASWVRELSLRSRGSDDAAAEPLQPLRRDAKPAPNGVAPPAPC